MITTINGPSSSDIVVYGGFESTTAYYEFFSNREIIFSLIGNGPVFQLFPSSYWNSLPEQTIAREHARTKMLEIFPGSTIAERGPFHDLVTMTDADLVMLKMLVKFA